MIRRKFNLRGCRPLTPTEVDYKHCLYGNLKFCTAPCIGNVTREQYLQQVLAACKEFNVACGYPATATDIEMRMQQGFSMFIINWGEQGFKAVDIGRKAAGRPVDGAGQH